jgi:hypothetical protein
VRLASIYTDLVFHLLAFVAPPRGGSHLAHAASLASERYVTFARASMPADVVEPCERDAPILSALFARDDVATGIQLLAILHDDVDAALAAALKGVRDLDASEVASSWAQTALSVLPEEPVEIARVAIALAGSDFARIYGDVLAPHARALLDEIRPLRAALETKVGALATVDLRLSTTLGPRGRGFDGTVVVGARSLPGEPLDPSTPLVLGVHEVAVQAASRVLGSRGIDPTWARAERVALLAAEEIVRGSVIEEPYAGWRSGIGTAGLIEPSAVPVGAVKETVEALRGPSA